METEELLDSFHEALRIVNKRLEALEIIHTRYTGPRGPKGDKGDSGTPGLHGRNGRDGIAGVSNVPGPIGPAAKDAVTTIALGQLASGREAMASLRHEGDVVILDLVLPRGAQGDAGAPGRDASIDDIRKVVVEVLRSEEIRQLFRGERGETGMPGRNGKIRLFQAREESRVRKANEVCGESQVHKVRKVW